MIKASLLRCCEMSWQSLTKLKALMRWNRIDADSLNSQSLRIAQANDEQGEPMVFCRVANVLFVDNYLLSPQTDRNQMQLCGDLIDSTIAQAAQLQGIRKVLIALPDNMPGLPDEEFTLVRVYTRKVPQSISGGISQLHSQQVTSSIK